MAAAMDDCVSYMGAAILPGHGAQQQWHRLICPDVISSANTRVPVKQPMLLLASWRMGGPETETRFKMAVPKAEQKSCQNSQKLVYLDYLWYIRSPRWRN